MVKLHYELHGTGDRTIVLVSGYQTTIASWREFWRPLTKQYQVLVLDNRGAGKSPTTPIGFSVQDMAGDVTELIGTLGLHSVYLFGHSMGGAIAQAVAYHSPQLVKKLVLASSFTRFPARSMYQVSLMQQLVKQGCPLDDRVKIQLPWIFGSTFFQNSDQVDKEIATRIKLLPNSDLTGLEGQTHALISFDSSAWVGKIKIPTHVVVGEEDLFAPLSCSQELAQRIKGSFSVIQKAGHNLPVEAPERLIQELSTFIKE